MKKPSVFISYARQDDSHFVGKLYDWLVAEGFEVWYDIRCMPSRQLSFYQEIQDSILTKDRFILVIGPGASRSEYVKQEWKCALRSDKVIIPIIRIGEYDLIPKELSWIHCIDFRNDLLFHDNFTLLLSDLLAEVPSLAADTIDELPYAYYALDRKTDAIKRLLLQNLKSTEAFTQEKQYIGLHGMGGIGKSCLAKAVAKDPEVRRAFPDCIIWLQFGKEPNILGLQNYIAKCLNNDSAFTSESHARGILRTLLLEKRVLFIFDNVWQKNHIEPFLILGPRCKALITTRDLSILDTFSFTVFEVRLLSEYESRQILANYSGLTTDSLPTEAVAVADECDHLPLALELCGRMACGEYGISWRSILETLKRKLLKKIEYDVPVEKGHENIWRVIETSFESLPTEECKNYFLELAVFRPEGSCPQSAISTLWKYQHGLDVIDIEKYLRIFHQRSLLNVLAGKSTFTSKWMHDLVHDYIAAAHTDMTSLHSLLVHAYVSSSNGILGTGPDDGYFYKNICHHLTMCGDIDQLENMLIGFHYAYSKCKYGYFEDLLTDYQLALSKAGPHKSILRIWLDFLLSNSHLIRRGGEIWGMEKILIQVGIEHAINSPVSKTILSWMSENTGANLVFQLFNILRPVNISYQTCQLVLENHTHNIEEVVELPNNTIASWSDDRTCRFWDMTTGRNLFTFHNFGTVSCGYFGVPFPRPGCVALSQNMIAIFANHKELRLVDLEKRSIVNTYRHDDVIRGAMLVDTTRLCSWSEDRTAVIWNIVTSEKIHTFKHTGWVFGARMIDSTTLATCSGEHAIHFWDLQNYTKKREFTGSTKDIKDFFILKNGFILAVTGSEPVTIWDPVGKLQSNVHMDLEYYMKEGKKCFKKPDGTYMPLITIEEKNEPIGLHFSDFSLQFQNISNPFHLPSISAKFSIQFDDLSVLMADSDFFYHLLPDGRLLVFQYPIKKQQWSDSVNGMIKINNRYDFCFWISTTIVLSHEGMVHILRGHTDNVIGVIQLSSKNNHYLLSWGDDGRLIVWDQFDGTKLFTFYGHSGKIRGARELSDGRIVSYAWLFVGTRTFGRYIQDDTTIRIWKLPDTLYPIRQLEPNRFIIRNFYRGTNKELFIYGYTDQKNAKHDIVIFYDGATMEQIASFAPKIGTIESILELSKHCIVTLSNEGTIIAFWDMKNHEFLNSFRLDTQYTTALSVLDRVVIGTSDCKLSIWSHSGKSFEDDIHNKLEHGVVISDKTALLILDNSPNLILVDVDTQLVRKIKAHAAAVLGTQLLPSGNIVSWGKDNCLCIWNSKDLSQVAALQLNFPKADVFFPSIDNSVFFIMEISGSKIFWFRKNDIGGLWNYRTNEIHIIEQFIGIRKAIALSGERVLIITNKDSDNLSIFDTVLLQCTISVNEPIQTIGAFFLNESMVITWSNDNYLYLRDSKRMEVLSKYRLPAHTSADAIVIKPLAANPNFFSINSEKSICFFTISENELVFFLWNSEYEIWQVHTYEDGMILVNNGFKGLVTLQLYDGIAPCSFSTLEHTIFDKRTTANFNFKTISRDF